MPMALRFPMSTSFPYIAHLAACPEAPGPGNHFVLTQVAMLTFHRPICGACCVGRFRPKCSDGGRLFIMIDTPPLFQFYSSLLQCCLTVPLRTLRIQWFFPGPCLPYLPHSGVGSSSLSLCCKLPATGVPQSLDDCSAMPRTPRSAFGVLPSHAALVCCAAAQMRGRRIGAERNSTLPPFPQRGHGCSYRMMGRTIIHINIQR